MRPNIYNSAFAADVANGYVLTDSESPAVGWFKFLAKKGWTYEIGANSGYWVSASLFDQSGQEMLAEGIYGDIIWVAPSDGVYLFRLESTVEGYGFGESAGVLGYGPNFKLPERSKTDRVTTEYAVPSDPLNFQFSFELGVIDNLHHILDEGLFRTQPGAVYQIEKPADLLRLTVCNRGTLEDVDESAFKRSNLLGDYVFEICRTLEHGADQMYMTLPFPYTWLEVSAGLATLTGVVNLTGVANDHGSGPGDATPAFPGTPVTGQLQRHTANPDDDRDYFSVRLESGTHNTLNLSLNPLDQAEMVVFPPGSPWPMWGTDRLGVPGVVEFLANVDGDYIVRVSGPAIHRDDAADPRADGRYT